MKRSGPIQRRTPLARSTKPMKRTRLKPRSDKKQAWHDKYMEAKRKKLADQKRISGHTYCERCLKPCEPDGHHPDGRLKEKILIFFLLCREDHDWCHANKKAARDEGWFA